MSDDKERREEEREEKEREDNEVTITPDGGVSLPIGGGFGIDTHGHPTIRIGPGFSIPLGGD